jgi:hypothetical protein
LHLVESLLLVALIGEADETVPARHTRDGVTHDLGRLAGWVLVLEERHEDVFVHLRTEVAHENAEFGTTIVAASVCKATSRCPVELELTVGVGNDLSVELKGTSGSIWVLKVDEAVTGVGSAARGQSRWGDGWEMRMRLPGELVTNHLDVDLISHAEPDAAHKVLIDPGFEFTHPVICLAHVLLLIHRLRARAHVGAYQRVVF